LYVAALIDACAVVVEVVEPVTETGAPGTCGETPKVNVDDPVEVAPPLTVVVAVIVNVVVESATVGVPEITPVAVSIERPAGSAPLTEYVVLIGDVAVMEAVIGVIALPTVPVADDVEIATASGVVKVVAVELSPAPLLFTATETTE
jgi:hypothetical protein